MGNEMSFNKWMIVACTGGVLITPLPVTAGLDHKITFDESGIWNRDVQKGVEYGSIAIVLGGALWEGGEDRLGRTFWQAVDSTVVSSVAAQAGKYIFSRSRPTQTDDPNQWFQGSGHQSFPSGEVALVSSAVAPFVFEYGREHPAIWGLELFTVYDMVARVKSQAHWQTDVLAGAALGTAVGYFANHRNQPFFLGLMPGGIQVGYRTKF